MVIENAVEGKVLAVGEEEAELRGVTEDEDGFEGGDMVSCASPSFA